MFGLKLNEMIVRRSMKVVSYVAVALIVRLMVVGFGLVLDLLLISNESVERVVLK